MTEQITPYKPTHPGEVLHDELRDSMNMITPELKHNHNHTNHINQKNHSSDNFATALNIPADFWMQFQSQYEQDRERIER